MAKSLLEKREENMMKRVSYWRKNPHKFIDEYLGIKLHLFQKFLIYMMDKYPRFMFIGARGVGKSWLIAVYCVCRCILYPGTQIIISSRTKRQAGLVISQKITALYNNHAAVRFEIGDIKNISTAVNNSKVKFPNGSNIEAVANGDSSRGYRANLLILDEFRMIDKNMVDKVFKPMANVKRQAPYMHKPQYKHLQERNRHVYLSSAWYKSHWAWTEFVDFVKGMLADKDSFAITTPWQLSVNHDLLSIEDVIAERESDTFDETGFQMEYDGLFPGENERGYFKLDSITKCRTLSRVFIPPNTKEYVENRARSKPKKLGNMVRQNFDTEVRIISLDVALMGSSKKKKNDTSSFTCMRLLQEGNEYRKEIVYLESIATGIDTSDLAIRLKQLHHDFEADYVVVDTMGAGIGVFDALCKTLYDEERDVEYEPWASMNDEDMNERMRTNGKPCMYSVKAAAQFNSEIAVQLRTALEKGRIELPMSDIIRKDELVAEGGFARLTGDEKARKLQTFYQATALQGELVALEYKLQGANIKIEEVGNATKDRYSSLAYCNWFANELEKNLREELDDADWSQFMFVSGGLER